MVVGWLQEDNDSKLGFYWSEATRLQTVTDLQGPEAEQRLCEAVAVNANGSIILINAAYMMGDNDRLLMQPVLLRPRQTQQHGPVDQP